MPKYYKLQWFFQNLGLKIKIEILNIRVMTQKNFRKISPDNLLKHFFMSRYNLGIDEICLEKFSGDAPHGWPEIRKFGKGLEKCSIKYSDHPFYGKKFQNLATMVMPNWFRSNELISTNGLHRCWRRMLETKFVGENSEMFVTVLADFVTNIVYLLA